MGRSRNLSQFKPSTTGLVETDDITDLAVTTGKMANTSVTPAKMANGGLELGMRNRIINGDMRIDQRNAGASVTVNTTAPFPVDRWNTYSDLANMTAQRSTVAPAGFTNSLIHTVGTGATPSAAQVSRLEQRVEGLNFSDLGWGTANAQSVALSFWARSSITGTHSGVLTNGAQNRCYPFTFTISQANTWEYKTIVIAGDTSGTWATDNTVGCKLMFNMGTGSSGLAAAGAWTASNVFGATGSVQLAATSGATFYLTGVQLEPGTVATPFERRPYGLEFSLCQRYFETGMAKLYAAGATGLTFSVPFRVTKRANATISYSSPGSGTYYPPTLTEWAATQEFFANRASNEMAFAWAASSEL